LGATDPVTTMVWLLVTVLAWGRPVTVGRTQTVTWGLLAVP
jgi:hypothetical protein